MMIVCMLIISSKTFDFGEADAIPWFVERQAPESACEGQSVPDRLRNFAVNKSHHLKFYMIFL
jgi:hypothetical protein